MRIALPFAIVACVASTAASQPSASAATPGMVIHPIAALAWTDGPATLPKGTKMAILEGDPAKPGVFTMRIKFPAGMHVAPHFHTQTEHATVMAGTLHVGMGDTFDKGATKSMATGSFGYWTAGMKHFAWMEGDVILQLHGQGPWTITYVNPADDPRNTSKK